MQVSSGMLANRLAATTSSKYEDTTSRNTSLPTEAQSLLININYTNQATIETLSGIIPVTTQNIIAFREENGRFTRIEEIQIVLDIGPVKFRNMKDFLTVDEQP